MEFLAQISDDLVVLRQYLRFVKEHEKEIQRPSLVQLLDAVRLTAFVMFTRNRSRAPASYRCVLETNYPFLAMFV